MKPPAFQFYADDFIGGTITMNHQERGLYILLLCLQWTQGKVNGDDIAHLSADMPQHSVFKVRGKFVEFEDGGLRNERLEHERSKQDAFRAKKEVAGKAGAEKRWHNHGTPIGLPLANGMANGMANDSSPSPSPSPSPSSVSDLQSPSPKGRVRFAPPTDEESRLHSAKCGMPEIERQKFMAHYESNGWKVSGRPMVLWRSAMNKWKLTWETGRYGKPTPSKPEPKQIQETIAVKFL